MLPKNKNRVRRFQEEESGVITILGLLLLMLMLMVGGLGVDFMHAEMRRTDLQHTLDRAVLAAADLDQKLEPADVVVDYFNKAGLDGSLIGNPVVDDGMNYRTVSARARIDTDTLLLPLAGIDQLNNFASGMAEERIANVEVSLVLDISGSMRTGDRMEKLQSASGKFIDTLLQKANEDLVSISVVPYSGQVNAGPLLFNEMNTTHVHDYAHCIEFTDAQFNSTTYDSSHTYEQMQYYQYYQPYSNSYYWYNDMTRTDCPRYENERITPFSQDAAALKAQINALEPRAYTSIFLGMKWATMLLDPTMRPVITQLTKDTVPAADRIDAEFKGRPANFNDPETLKTIVLMTDGENVSTYRLKDWRYNSETERERWASNNVRWWTRHNDYYDRNNYFDLKYSSSKGDTLLRNICDAARANGIVVWSVGLEVSSSNLDDMRYCASSEGHFFEATEEDIEDVFSTIARQVNFLRLTQ